MSLSTLIASTTMKLQAKESLFDHYGFKVDWLIILTINVKSYLQNFVDTSMLILWWIVSILPNIDTFSWLFFEKIS